MLLLNGNISVSSGGNILSGPLASLPVRQAVNKALNKTALVAALSGLEDSADRLFSTDTPYANTPIGPLPVFDVVGANTLLQQDGWVGSPFRVRYGVQLAGELIFVSNDASAAAIGERQ
jgi:ABC-type transport system substrate-binding protein